MTGGVEAHLLNLAATPCGRIQTLTHIRVCLCVRVTENLCAPLALLTCRSIRLVLALLTSLGTQGWQLVEKVQATGFKTDHHNLLFVHSAEMAQIPPAFFAISIPRELPMPDIRLNSHG